MSEIRRSRRSNIFGFVLVAIGAVYLLSNIFGVGRFIAELTWPLFVIGPGAGLFVLMMLAGKKSGWLAVPASVITVTGLLLFIANLFNHWESWAYTWTLLFGAAGLGMLISHYWSGRPRGTRFGTFLVKSSLVAFVGFGLFFELLIFAGSRGLLGRLLWPAVLITIGGYLLLRGRDETERSPGPRTVRSKARETEVEFEPLKVGNKEETVASEANKTEAR